MLLEGLRPVALGIAAGLVVSIAAGRVMAQLLFGVAATDIPTYVAVIALLFAAASVATWIPARRVLRVDPMSALRAK
jgi:putative ABC transport system permease protein